MVIPSGRPAPIRIDTVRPPKAATNIPFSLKVLDPNGRLEKRTNSEAVRLSALCRFCCRSRLMNAVADDSVSLTRFVAEARDDGAAQSRPGAAFLFVLS